MSPAQSCEESIWYGHRQARPARFADDSPSRSLANPDPPAEVVEQMLDIYETKIYFQPLPLFAVRDLRAQITGFPQFLRWSFFALCLHYLESPFYSGNEALAIDAYMSSAQQTAMGLAAEGTTDAHVVQSLCLLALCEIMGTCAHLDHVLRVLADAHD